VLPLALLGALAPLAALAPDVHAGTDDVAATRAEVRQIQEQLNALGYDAGPVDGAYGQQTRKAILAFERDHDMPAIGMPDDEVRRRIEKALARKRAGDGDGDGGNAGQRTQQREQDRNVEVEDTGEKGAASTPSDRARDRQQQAHVDLPGTRWRLHHPQGQNIVLEFRPNGELQAPAGNWRWERKDGRVVIHYDSGSRLSSRLVGKLHTPRHMDGWGQDTFGERWHWSADRLPDRGES
jgi:hypothetical protein